MKKIIILLAFVGVFSASAQETADFAKLTPTETQKKVQQFVTQFLNNYHYKKFKIDDELSSKIFDNYLNDLDRGKNYFVKSEVDSFEKYRYLLDEAILSGDLSAPYEIFNLYRDKYLKRYNYIATRLNEDFDYNTDLIYELEDDETEWKETEGELDAEWNKIVLSQAVNMKLSGSTDSAITSILTKRYERYEKRVAKWRAEDVFQTFMNSFTEVIDPHTNYMIPSNAEQFNIDMSQSLEGIGARLMNENDYVMITDVIPGGPLYKTRQANKNDYILGVAQGDDGEFQDIIGWLTDDAVKLIRGKKGSVVRLQLLAADAPAGSESREVRIVREKIKLEEAVVSSQIIEVQKDKKTYRVGIIDIPMFYRDFASARSGADFQSTTKDAKVFLDQYRDEKVDAVVIDLRNNGGGSLTEAISLTGLFIPDGPVVQRRTGKGKVDQEFDADLDVAYAGPLVVLQNRFSASASEIFAGAIQDYSRGIIVGEQSFGKGTVQQLVDLDQFLLSPRVASSNKQNGNVGFEDKERYGQLKLTTEKFYRITGESTQRKGVIPDIAFPTPFKSEETGESSRESALEYDVVPAANYTKTIAIGDKAMNKVKAKFDQRVKADKDIVEVASEIEKYKILKEKKSYSLNLEERQKEKEGNETNRAAIKKLGKSETGEDRSEDLYLTLAEGVAIDLINSWK
ncbi:carboxyl-terminal processing protease [Spirosomataceae bacterium TFI 002]|nr:carboxyl-terminal processing protease [Spirosomataceae bacterium TFI 002]